VSEKGEEISVETPFIVARILLDGETSIFATGVYKDLFRLDEGVPKLNERVVVCDSSRVDTLLALPL
jgi:anthranilate 1,2-dioxygenase small subunit